MNEEQFKHLFAMAECCNLSYQRGYRRGLLRIYHGENFGTAEEHDQWMNLSGLRSEMGRGYRDGFAGRQPDIQP